MRESVSSDSVDKMKFTAYSLSSKWDEVLGEPGTNFSMCIWGASGGGKSTFAMMLAKELSQYGKVYYNSVEQGVSKSLQDLLRRLDMKECKPGTFMIGDRDTYDEMLLKLKKNRAKFVFIDSLQYIGLTTSKFQELIEKFPKKAFIIISWAEPGGEPKGEYGKSVRYMSQIKIKVQNGVATIDSRYGGTKKQFEIFPKPIKTGDQLPIPLNL